jgi:hypothetical protein
MVCSTIHHFVTELEQICATLEGFGYEVHNSHKATVKVDPRISNLDNCLDSVRKCDVFFGIIRPEYGSGVVGKRSIFHQEVLEAVGLDKPRWVMVHRDVTTVRRLLKDVPLRQRRAILRKNPVIDDPRVFDIYDAAVRQEMPLAKRTGNWVQEYYKLEEIFTYLETQFEDVDRVRSICQGRGTP